MDSADDVRKGIILESPKETFLVTRNVHEGKERYTLSVFGPSSLNASQPCPSTSSTPPADAASKMQDTPTAPLPEPSEECKTPTNDPPLSGATTDPPDAGTSQESGSKGEENDASSKPPSIRSPRAASPKPTLRVLQSNLVEDDFSFDNDTILIRKGSEHRVDGGTMVVDGDGEGDALKMRVLRWRWYLEP